MPIGNLPEVLSQRILAGRILVGRLGVVTSPSSPRQFVEHLEITNGYSMKFVKLVWARVWV